MTEFLVDMSKVTEIILEGGGNKGACHFGALAKLYENHTLFENIKHVCGSSAGAFAAMCIGLGADPTKGSSFYNAIMLDGGELSKTKLIKMISNKSKVYKNKPGEKSLSTDVSTKYETDYGAMQLNTRRLNKRVSDTIGFLINTIKINEELEGESTLENNSTFMGNLSKETKAFREAWLNLLTKAKKLESEKEKKKILGKNYSFGMHYYRVYKQLEKKSNCKPLKHISITVTPINNKRDTYISEMIENNKGRLESVVISTNQIDDLYNNGDIRLSDGVTASQCFPRVWAPHRIDRISNQFLISSEYYADGGILSNIPINASINIKYEHLESKHDIDEALSKSLIFRLDNDVDRRTEKLSMHQHILLKTVMRTHPAIALVETAVPWLYDAHKNETFRKGLELNMSDRNKCKSRYIWLTNREPNNKLNKKITDSQKTDFETLNYDTTNTNSLKLFDYGYGFINNRYNTDDKYNRTT